MIVWGPVSYYRTVRNHRGRLTRRSLLVTLASVPVLALLPKPSAGAARPPRIVFFGDSLTYGLHASEPDRAFAQLLRARLAHTDDNGPAYFFLQDPYGLLDDAERRLPYVLAAQPTLVFLELGHHEIWSNQAEIDRFEERYARLLDQLLANDAEVLPSTLAWLGDPPGSFAHAASLTINRIILRLAEVRGLTVADLWTPTYLRYELLSTEDDQSFIAPYRGDNLHPNDAGHRALADAFWKVYRARRQGPIPAAVP